MTDRELLREKLDISSEDARLLHMVIQVKSNEQIAEVLLVRPGTVKSRLFRLYKKMNVKNRVAAALKGAQVLWANGRNAEG